MKLALDLARQAIRVLTLKANYLQSRHLEARRALNDAEWLLEKSAKNVIALYNSTPAIFEAASPATIGSDDVVAWLEAYALQETRKARESGDAETIADTETFVRMIGDLCEAIGPEAGEFTVVERPR